MLLFASPFPKYFNFPLYSRAGGGGGGVHTTFILQIAQVHQIHSARLEQQVTMEINLSTI